MPCTAAAGQKNIYEAMNNAVLFLFEYKRPIFWGDMGGFRKDTA